MSLAPYVGLQQATKLELCATLLGLLLVLDGCGPVARVNRAKTPLDPANTLQECQTSKYRNTVGCKLPGVPFYGVGYKCTHTTVWIQPIYRVSISSKSPSGEIKTWETKTFTLKQYRDHAQSFVESLKLDAYSQDEVNEYARQWNEMATSPDPYTLNEDTINASPEVYLYSNSVAQERFVDTSSMMFLNTSKPLAGSAEATTTLNSDGTLTTGSSKEESKTFATVASLLPVSDVVKSATKLAALDQHTPLAIYTFQTSVKTEFYKHTHTASSADAPPCKPPNSASDVAKYPANIIVEHIGELPPAAPATETPKPSDPKKEPPTPNN